MLMALDQVQFEFQQCDCGTFLVQKGSATFENPFCASPHSNKTSVSRYEEDCNRFFIVNDFFSAYYPDFAYSEDDLLAIANAFAKRLKAKLQEAFPEKSFVVKIVGDQLVDVEPLELCVTFYSVSE